MISLNKRSFARMIGGMSILSLLTATMLAGCGGGSSSTAKTGGGSAGSSSGNVVKIGALVDKSGKGADWGKKNEIAARIAVDEINAAGGINGAKIELVVKDTGGKNEDAVNLTRTLADEGVAAIVGPFFSGECEVAFPQANKLGVPIISPSSAKAGVSEKNRPWAFRNSMTDDKLLRDATPLFVKAYNVKTVAVIHDEKDAWSKAVGSTDLPREFKAAGVNIVNEGNYLTYKTGETNFAAIVTQIKTMNPDAIAFGGLYNEAASFAKEMERQGLKKPVLGGVGMYSAALIQQGGKAVEDFVATSCFNVYADNPRVKSFVDKFKPEAAKITPADDLPGSFEAQFYETFYMISNVLKKANKNGSTPVADLRNTIKDGLANLKDFEGLTGKTSIDDKGDGIKASYPMVVKNGKYEVLK
ncbi:branched-chain amino acid abc transporter, amino acid-binding protein [Heliomicrobium modesticaldum Ice1]|uniref:Branched-chain amino acid abc transporter, amino acid-binding protein n=1 Tax=Heliobacterium modesticaldum (strain ATCC 51547 / Ice1) TaxID=498761 RepID=B0TAM9_HELMI|nr:ABC transporter substrate-binding protein [Heliomicrobium modesticaldum]ABZ83681.1 branched-chain amino acid abc transporter, amino acid-binding protein [Heliomicrobium modesticaldum Ice1]